MKVFISWSGERSRQVAELLDDWIQCVLQAVDPWMSTKDIDRGALWFTEINDQLSNTSIGIVCLTNENKNKPWILFESGALAKGLHTNRVCTFLIDLTATDLENPLAQFNHTLPDKIGLFKLIRTINSTLGDQILKEQILEKVFETYWPQFQEKFNQVIANTPDSEVIEKRNNEDILVDILSTVRGFDRRLREVEATPTRIGDMIVNSSTKKRSAVVSISLGVNDGDIKESSDRLALLFQAFQGIKVKSYSTNGNSALTFIIDLDYQDFPQALSLEIRKLLPLSGISVIYI